MSEEVIDVQELVKELSQIDGVVGVQRETRIKIKVEKEEVIPDDGWHNEYDRKVDRDELASLAMSHGLDFIGTVDQNGSYTDIDEMRAIESIETDE